MMVPAPPVANLVVGQARFALGTLDTFFDAMFGFGHASELRFVCISSCVGQVVIGLDDAPRVTFPKTNDDQDFFVTFLPLVRARDHATLDHLDDERTFRAIAHVDLGPGAFADCSSYSLWVLQHCPQVVSDVALIRAATKQGGVFYVLNNNRSVVPTNRGWVNDGTNLKSLLEKEFVLQGYAKLPVECSSEGLVANTFIGRFTK